MAQPTLPATEANAPSSAAEATRMRVRVLALLDRDFIRVVVGPGSGLLDGGEHQDWPIANVPADLRSPNAEFFCIPGGSDEPPCVERFKEADN